MDNIIQCESENKSNSKEKNNKYNQCISFFNRLDIKDKGPYGIKKNISVIVFKNDNDPMLCDAYFMISDYSHNPQNITAILNQENAEKYFAENYKILYPDEKITKMLNIDLDTMKVICYIFSFKYVAKCFSISTMDDMLSNFSETHPMFYGNTGIPEVPFVTIYLQNGIISIEDYFKYEKLNDNLKIPLAPAAKKKAFNITTEEYCEMCYDGTIKDFSFHKLNKECLIEAEKKEKKQVKSFVKKILKIGHNK